MADHLAIFSSPREDGFSARAHRLFLSGLGKARSVETVFTFTSGISPCSACGFCAAEPGCSIIDGMSRLYNEIENAASISVSAPLYFSSIPGTLKNFIDRCQTLWEIRERGRIFVPKKGFVIISAGSLSGKMPDHALAVVKHFFNTINCSLNSADVIFIDNTDVRADIISEKLHLIIAAAERFRSCFLPPE